MVCINSYYRQTSTQSVFICKDNGRCGQGNNKRSSCMMKCLIIILRFCEWFAPCILKATVKRTTKTLRILPPTFKPGCLATNQVGASCVHIGFWLERIRGSYVTCYKTSLPWAGKMRATCTDFLAKSTTTVYFSNNFPQPATGWYCCKTDLIRGK